MPTRLAPVLSAALLAACTLSLSLEARALEDDTVIVTRGGSSVTVADLRARLMEVPAEDRVEFISDRRRLDTTLRQLLETRQLADAGRRAGIDRSPEYLAAVRLGTERALAALYNQQLRAEGLARADLEQIARERFLANPPPPSWTIEARHVLVKPFDDRNAAFAKASEILERARAGESIEVLAARYSDDRGSRETGGLIKGSSESFDPAFSNAVLALEKPGDLAPVTESRFGFHVIQLVAKTEAGRASFESQRERLVEEIADSVARRHIIAQHERLFADPPELNESAIDQLLADPESIVK